uniref:Aldo-keto reductase AMT2 n=1 Tax=Alternaria alternata TaxID=5599 RepID=AMT2_ALTAL|nr:RecName: Full=Aldo-keto reductase AMT2; AltName: Full=AM-toxin biosynthesis protein 2 [Alternaria alternata]BAC84994.1 aldo-keto reductase [Alternaria alternata]BAI44761.1 aldo-keto reductase [Alternaria alternata]BAI44803.1 aldo-keto reductase [Alternaria alternata]BES52855.1 aldo-keto reductase [Alternaria alternata]
MLNYKKWTQPPNSLIKSIKASRAAYRRLGNSGLLVSNPILGGMHIGDPRWYDWVLDEKDSIALLKAAYDRGINTWDTANIYSNGESERIMGRALRSHNIPRSKVVIMTKCFRAVTDPDVDGDIGSSTAFFPDLTRQSKDYVNHCGLSRASVFQQVEASLRRLNTDYIDVLHIHRFDHHVPPEETMKALHDLVQMNKVRYLGASSMWAHEFAILQHTAEKNNWTKFVSMQNHYNLLYREEEREMIKYCNLTGVGLIPWGPLAAGKLARPPDGKASTFRAINGGAYKDHNPAESEQIARRVHQIAVSRGVPMSHVALAWLNKRVVSPVIGLSSVERMDEVLDARALELSDEEESRLEDPYKAQPPQGHS